MQFTKLPAALLNTLRSVITQVIAHTGELVFYTLCTISLTLYLPIGLLLELSSLQSHGLRYYLKTEAELIFLTIRRLFILLGITLTESFSILIHTYLIIFRYNNSSLADNESTNHTADGIDMTISSPSYRLPHMSKQPKIASFITAKHHYFVEKLFEYPSHSKTIFLSASKATIKIILELVFRLGALVYFSIATAWLMISLFPAILSDLRLIYTHNFSDWLQSITHILILTIIRPFLLVGLFFTETYDFIHYTKKILQQYKQATTIAPTNATKNKPTPPLNNLHKVLKTIIHTLLHFIEDAVSKDNNPQHEGSKNDMPEDHKTKDNEKNKKVIFITATRLGIINKLFEYPKHSKIFILAIVKALTSACLHAAFRFIAMICLTLLTCVLILCGTPLFMACYLPLLWHTGWYDCARKELAIIYSTAKRPIILVLILVCELWDSMICLKEIISRLIATWMTNIDQTQTTAKNKASMVQNSQDMQHDKITQFLFVLKNLFHYSNEYTQWGNKDDKNCIYVTANHFHLIDNIFYLPPYCNRRSDEQSCSNSRSSENLPDSGTSYPTE